ncbi:hypothetical protein E6P09_15255 (plasmid) [Haloferax mediterranei ATCC 33500]|uniref:Uncharacterized protein n=1 Tax=Haloferax mediterranei (strain ATCC 33500 / DSM 1411 / JCM 8866 / NBRC 14739 / NCIMB 2177 / R-4) TaxID=523841 RepID=I3RAC5_HALMT|nr:hypothetical protein [Haloferax mediterranei]AFK21185.1 hypothetical protein HFX_6058 [Haloferax mediterranei ATCC 33500]ELZ97480.1 hypothetical protein C439_19198 [Haloferax mediterranei ATCC 33500]MDX5990228.1 hypothetical protein [Haloferax mediterranei ATCC 33500]QCQ76701.1 hypothetical protein E6P09_15255 [Haloferax mediterranei ATCC 33500]
MVSAATLDEAIETYNEYRSPMATAELIDYAADTFVVEFEGPFCRMCCDYDYFEDLIYELAALGEEPSTIDISEISYEGTERFVVRFCIT